MFGEICPKMEFKTVTLTRFFSQTTDCITFMRLLNHNYMQNNQEKVMRKSWENGVTEGQMDGKGCIYRTLRQSRGPKKVTEV